MTKAILFPGQGSQYPGMGREMADSFIEARHVFEEVDEVLKQKLSQIIFSGQPEELALTENTQPALMAVSLAILRVLEKQGKLKIRDIAAYVAGHSLGEYSALTAAESFTLADSATLLRIRGKAMQQAVPKGQGGMVVLLGADLDLARKIAAEAAAGDICQAANDNSPGQVVLSGSTEAIARVAGIATGHGVKRTVALPVSAPFHSELMAPAAKTMQEALANVEIKSPSLPLIANVTAMETSSPAEIRRLLVEQVTGMVRWRESVVYMENKGVDNIVEIGAGSVLSGLTKRSSAKISTVSLERPADIEKFLESL